MNTIENNTVVRDNARSAFNKVGKFIKNSVISGIQSTCSVSHLTLRYGIDVVEIAEASFMKRMTGQLKEDTIKQRQSNSNRVRLENKRAYLEVKSKLKNMVATRFGTSDEAVEETLIHGEA